MRRKPIVHGAFLLSVFTIAFAFLARPTRADNSKKARGKIVERNKHAPTKKARARIVELNKQALLSCDNKDFETAKVLLTKALKEARQAGLVHDKMTARTYVHLGAVYWVGFHERAVAIANFVLAKKLRPDIQLTPSVATTDLKSIFDLAGGEPATDQAITQTSSIPPPRAHPTPQPGDSSDIPVAGTSAAGRPSVVKVREEEEPPPSAGQDGYQGRRPGATWLSVGGGLGWGFVPAGNLEWEKNMWVSRMTMNTGAFHLLPEVGHQFSHGFGLALQGRWEFIRQERLLYPDPDTGTIVQLSKTGSPPKMAFALFARAIWYTDLVDSGSLQLSYSGDIGGGYVRFPVKPAAKFKPQSDEIDPDYSIAATDARPMGPFLVGGSGGLIYHLGSHLALAADVRLLTGLPAYGAVIEGAFSAQIAAFGGTAKPTPAKEEGEDE